MREYLTVAERVELGKKDTFDGAVAAFATDYADLNARDHAALGDALRDGRLATF